MSTNKIAQAIEDVYVEHHHKDFPKSKEDVNAVNEMSRDTGVALAYLFSELNTDCDARTDWCNKIFEFNSLIKELLVIIGKPGMLDHLHPSNQERASFNLMKLHEFFEDLNDKETVYDWLSWLMLDQFPDTNNDVTLEDTLRSLSI